MCPGCLHITRGLITAERDALRETAAAAATLQNRSNQVRWRLDAGRLAAGQAQTRSSRTGACSLMREVRSVEVAIKEFRSKVASAAAVGGSFIRFLA